MKRSLAFVSVFGLFLLGIVIGALGMHVYDARSPMFIHRGDGMRGRAHAERLERMLGLTPEQKRQFDEIMRESRAEGETIHAEMLPRVREHMERTRERIDAILTPEQRERFDDIARHQRGRFERFFLGGPSHPPSHSP